MTYNISRSSDLITSPPQTPTNRSVESLPISPTTPSIGGGSSSASDTPEPKEKPPLSSRVQIHSPGAFLQSPEGSLWSRFTHRIMMVWRSVFPPHKLHDEKYRIALNTLKESIDNESLKQLMDLISQSKSKKSKYYTSIFHAIRILKSEHSDIRLQYQMFHQYLREAIESPHYKEDTSVAKDILFGLCTAKFENTHLLNYHKEFQDAATGPAPTISNLASFTTALAGTNGALKKDKNHLSKSWPAQTKQKLEGNEILPGADNMGRSNVPEVRSEHAYSNGKKVRSLRHGTAVISPSGWTRKIAPEYQCYLDAKKNKNKQVLYINHQRADKASLMDKAEVKRSALLQQTDETQENFHCFSLPMDGAVFAGKQKLQATDAFKKQLIDSITQQTNGFRIPQSLAERTQDLKAEAIFKFVHTHYFDNMDALTEAERKEFLMIFYFYLKERAKYLLDADTIVTACKDNKDRGNASATIDELLLGYHLGEHANSPFLTDLHTRFFGAYMIKYEEIISKRVQLVIDVAKRVQNADTQSIQNGYGALIADDFSYKPTAVTIL